MRERARDGPVEDLMRVGQRQLLLLAEILAHVAVVEVEHGSLGRFAARQRTLLGRRVTVHIRMNELTAAGAAAAAAAVCGRCGVHAGGGGAERRAHRVGALRGLGRGVGRGGALVVTSLGERRLEHVLELDGEQALGLGRMKCVEGSTKVALEQHRLAVRLKCVVVVLAGHMHARVAQLMRMIASVARGGVGCALA